MVVLSSKYVIPFLGYNKKSNNYEFIGTSFLINPKFLITVGHNFLKECNKSYDNFAVYFENELIILEPPIYSEFEEKPIIKGNYSDLGIFFLNKSFKSEYKLSEDALKQNDRLEVFQISDNYKDYSNPLNLSCISVNYPNFAYRNYPNENGRARLTKYENCFNLQEKLVPGYSGSPVFKGKSILGMIVYSPIQNDIVVNSSMDYGTSVLKSQYILEILKIII